MNRQGNHFNIWVARPESAKGVAAGIDHAHPVGLGVPPYTEPKTNGEGEAPAEPKTIGVSLVNAAQQELRPPKQLEPAKAHIAVARPAPWKSGPFFWGFLLGWMFVGLFGAGSAVAATLPVTVVDVQGESRTGTLSKLTAAEITVSIENQPRIFATRDVLELRFKHERVKPHLWGTVIFLANGDRLVASPETIDDTAALARWQAFPSWKSVKIPLETITGFILEVPEIAAVRSLALRTVMDRQQKTDLADLKNGDQVSGEFLGLTENALRLKSPVGEASIERDSIRLVTMNRELVSFPALKGPAMLVSLTDGSLLTVTDLKLEADDRLTANAVFGAELELPVSSVRSIRCLGGRAVYLSDLTPAQYEHTPYLAGRWELKTDRNVLGEPLRLDGIEYPKGLGMHSQSVASYDLNGEYQTFRATVGVDDAADKGGSVVFAVEVDGKEVFRSEARTAKHSAIKLPPISLARAKRLTLKVEFGEFGDVQDYANWCEAVLIR